MFINFIKTDVLVHGGVPCADDVDECNFFIKILMMTMKIFEDFDDGDEDFRRF